VNPAHLWWGTHSDNTKDCYAKGRHPFSTKNHCPRGHEMLGENLVINSQGFKECRTCKREKTKERVRRWRERRKMDGDTTTTEALVAALPYQAVWNAITDAVKWREHKAIEVSVRKFKESLRAALSSTTRVGADGDRCQAPGCENLTDKDICDDCDQWVTEMAPRETPDEDGVRKFLNALHRTEMDGFTPEIEQELIDNAPAIERIAERISSRDDGLRKCALALFNAVKERNGRYVAVKADGPLNWTITEPRTEEALLAALETDAELDAEGVRERLRQACNGNYSAWASRNGVSASFVCDVLKGRREPSEAILTPLGLRRVVGYAALGARE
jgi:hypothetical protein